MPLMRVEVRNEYGLGAPDMYMEANNDESNEIFEGVAVAGLVGVLRQLGDLSDFAAEVFHGLQEEVVITSSRSNKLMSRIQRIEAALVPVEKALLAQQTHLHFANTAGFKWHAPVGWEKNHFVYDDMPQFIFDSYEDCRSPPHLHLLDRFDRGGPGSCLRRYSDPTIFINSSETSGDASQKVARDVQVQKSKKQKQKSWFRNAEVSGGALFDHLSARMQFPQSNVGGLASCHHPISTLKSDMCEQSNSDKRYESGYSRNDVCPRYSIQTKEQECHGSDHQDQTYLKDKVTDELNVLPQYCLSKEDGTISSPHKVIFRDRDPQKRDETYSSKLVSILCHEKQLHGPAAYLNEDDFEQKSLQNYQTYPQWPTSSPPLAHMKISVQPMGVFKASKLRVNFMDGFQLIPEVSNARLSVGLDSDDHTLCRSSPSVADDSHDHHYSGSDSELYDSLGRISFAESVPRIQDSSINLKDAASSSAEREASQGKNIDGNNFLNQIRRQSLSLRPTMPAKPDVPSRNSTNIRVMTILEKAIAIRQVVGSDDEEE